MKAKATPVDKILKENNLGIRIDLGCGAHKQPGFVGLDVRALPGVDVVCDLTKFPWPLPDACASLVMSSHLMEHLNPMAPDARLVGLLKLLLAKGTITKAEADEYIGTIDPGPLFIAFMDEVWRVLKPGGKFMSSMPYAGSSGFFQDPTHINQINAATFAYFDPLAVGGLYTIYTPKPWKIEACSYAVNGNIEVVLEKRLPDPSYG